MRQRVWSSPALLIIIIVIIGFGLRLFSVSWNTFPHADVEGDAENVRNFLNTGRLWDRVPDPDAPRIPTLFPIDSREGIPQLQHGPVWALLGSGLSSLRHGTSKDDGFLALRLLSALFGTVLIVFLWILARSVLDKEAALFCALWASMSYLLIDYSGNGAFYVFQGVLYLLWLVCALRPPTKKRAVLLGIVSGLAYLVNYQSIILLPVSIALELLQCREKKSCLLNMIIATVCASLTVSPWLIRNVILFGDPFAHHLLNSTYVFSKSGIHETVVGNMYRYPGFLERMTAILSMEVTSWFPNNMFYIARKLFILAPIAFIFFSYGLIDQVLTPKRRNLLLPILLLFTAHLIISAGWPITKFRYFVPLLPLVFLLSLEQITVIFPKLTTRRLWMILISVAIIFCSVKTYLSVPTHTYYYDGAITTDPFSGRGEWNYLRDNHLLSPP